MLSAVAKTRPHVHPALLPLVVMGREVAPGDKRRSPWEAGDAQPPPQLPSQMPQGHGVSSRLNAEASLQGLLSGLGLTAHFLLSIKMLHSP